MTKQFCPQGHDTEATGRYAKNGGCKACRRARAVVHTAKHREAQIAGRRARKAELVALMGGCCVRCGFDGPQEALDFDHIDPTEKTLTVASSLSPGEFERVKQEVLTRCQLLCANCHRIKTHAA